MTKTTHFGDYEKMYGSLIYEGLSVLDIGADYGTTAEFFLSRGASGVWVSEKNPDFLEGLKGYVELHPEVELVETLTEVNATEILALCPDVVKCDCEGCERHLLGVPDEVLGAPGQWVLETHTIELFDCLVSRFLHLGYRVTMVEAFASNPITRYVKVWTAVRFRGTE